MVAVGAFGQCPQVGVGRLRARVADVVVEGVPDQVPVAADAAGQGDEFGDAGMRRPRQPARQQLSAVLSFDLR